MGTSNSRRRLARRDGFLSWAVVWAEVHQERMLKTLLVELVISRSMMLNGKHDGKKKTAVLTFFKPSDQFVPLV